MNYARFTGLLNYADAVEEDIEKLVQDQGGILFEVHLSFVRPIV